MWNIYGKKYNLLPFLDKDPGGKFILERTRGLEDITALFETYHAFFKYRTNSRGITKI